MFINLFQMKKSILVFSLLLIFVYAFAQKKNLSMQEAILNARTTLAPENLRQLQFIAGTNDYVYLKKDNGTDVWMKGDFSAASDMPYLTLPQLNSRLKNSGIDTVSNMPPVQFLSEGMQLSVKGNKYLLDTKGGYKLVSGKDLLSKENFEQSPAGLAAYLDNYNLYVSSNGNAKQVTNDGSSDIVYASSVHRDEFGISKGTFWSNNGRMLAFYRMDQSMVTDYPVIDWTSTPAKNVNIKYPMAGDASHHVTIGLYNYEKNSTVWIQTGEPAEQYLTNIAWSPDDQFIFIAVLNRAQNHMRLNQYDALTGRFIKTLFEERDDKYTEPLHPLLFVKNKPGQFIWQSRRDGWNHLYLYDISGKLIKQLTRGNWEVVDVKQFDAKGDHIFYTSTEVSPVAVNLYVVNLKSSLRKRLSTANSMNNTIINHDGSQVLDISSSPENPRTIQLVNTKNGKTKTLLQAADPLQAYNKADLYIYTIKNKDGLDIYCRQYNPVGFDSTKKYPVIVYWYGGPHAQMITNSWNGGAGDYWFQYMAQRGYLVFSIDTRGSSSRGKEFEQAIFRQAGKPQMEDMETALQYLSAKNYIDQKRMGLFGWSYGGFMTTDFVLNHPGAFKAAVAGGPVMDWRMYEVMYGERYMDTPKENPDGYNTTNLIKQAGKLKDKLLLIHGLQDPVVVQQHSVNFVKACVDAGVQVDYMIYPGHEHNVLGKDRAHLYQKITDYFEQYLK